MKKYELVVKEDHHVTIEELGRLAGLRPEILRRYFIFGLIDPDIETPEPLFEDALVVRIHKIERLRTDLGINLAGCGLVLDLLDRIEELEDQIRYMRERL
jgi:DNA-binding transcriptional MerR regulator